MTKISGIYKITNNITGDFYIGSSNNIKIRWNDHKKHSKWLSRPGMKLYQAFIKYGLDNFLFEVLEETDNLKEREQYYIEQLKPIYNNYNAYGLNIERTKETKKRVNEEWYNSHPEYPSKKKRNYYDKLCIYEGETLNLSTLSQRLKKLGITHYYMEAKKYLIKGELK